ncbi:MAG: 50S ribosomal protein L11 methyltransferase [Verrucomicrobia bacterium]|nr:50S ribosomal protein L11 methyltransferase [Verrucomicrobiota bacterium]MBT6790319.1 50S ribosomal protein L11 methyltransferase [Verrucomicrobiota bacterium]
MARQERRGVSEELEQIVSVWVLTTPAAGGAVGALLESIFGSTASVWSEDRSNEAKVTVYLERDSVASAEEASLGQGLEILRAAGVDVGAGNWAVERVKCEDWSESWKKHFSPIEVGDRLLVKPEWEEIEPKLGQAVVILNPGMSFGTGHHATTLFCLKQLAECMPVGGGKSLLDAGAGSGILAISAAKLGYAPVEAWDFDPVAVGVARRNTEQNGLAQALAFENRDLTKMPPGGRQFDVVCANLMSELLVAEKSKLASWLAPTGRLVLAGVLLEQFPQVEAAFCGLGMELVAAESLDEWRSGAFQFSC